MVRDFPHIGIQMYRDADIYMIVHNPVVEYQVAVEKITAVEASPDRMPDKANKILFGGSHEQLRVLRDYLEKVSIDGMYGLFTEDQYYELLPQGVSKGAPPRYWRAIAASLALMWRRWATIITMWSC